MLLDIWVLARTVGAAMDDAVAPSGLVGREFVLYALLDGLGATTPTDLARRSGVPATTISKMLHRMVERGHLEERENPEDARSRLLILTDEGRRTLTRAREGFAELAGDVATELGDENEQVAWSLDRLRAVLATAAGATVNPAGEAARPDSATAHAVRYVGRPLGRDEEARVADFIDFVRSRADGSG
jgi:DNA-binding MarR family transcriptional regulator